MSRTCTRHSSRPPRKARKRDLAVGLKEKGNDVVENRPGAATRDQIQSVTVMGGCLRWSEETAVGAEVRAPRRQNAGPAVHGGINFAEDGGELGGVELSCGPGAHGLQNGRE